MNNLIQILTTSLVKVSSDDVALELMNDSPYGLTASIWTNAENNKDSEAAFLSFVDNLATGTVFLNRYEISISYYFIDFNG